MAITIVRLMTWTSLSPCIGITFAAQVLIDGQWLGSDQAVFWNSNGFHGPPKVFNESIPENTPVRYRACKGERAERVFWDCSRYWRYDFA
jgi:hypothetical protein